MAKATSGGASNAGVGVGPDSYVGGNGGNGKVSISW